VKNKENPILVHSRNGMLWLKSYNSSKTQVQSINK